MNKIVELKINPEVELLGFDAVALVEQPAIEENFYAFNSVDVDSLIVEELLKQELFVERIPGESRDSYLGRCIPKMLNEGYPEDQSIAICYEGLALDCPPATIDVALNLENRQHAIDTAHYGPLNPNEPNEEYWKKKAEMFQSDVASAKKALCGNCSFFVQTQKVLDCIAVGIGEGQGQLDPWSSIDAGDLGYCEAFDFKCAANRTCDAWVVGGPVTDEFNIDVTSLPDYINEIDKDKFESYTDYPEAAVNAAKRALEWRDSHPEQDCGTPVGWARANQLAKREPISEETIARMASFARHLQHEDVPYSEGCGGLMVDAWGGRAGIEWASRKLDELREENAIPTAVQPNILDPEGEALFIDDLDMATQDAILDALASIGISEDSLKAQGYGFNVYKSDANPELATRMMMGDYKTLYKYTGPQDNRNRKFCARLMQLNLLFRKEDIQKLSVRGANEQFGFYDIFQYKGSFNCRHNWTPVEVFVAEERAALVAAILAGQANTEVKKPVETFSSIGESTQFKFGVHGDQHIVIGPMMIPDRLILRIDEDGNPYHVFFSRETIKEIAYKMMREKLIDRLNIEHNAADTVGGHLLESWIIEDSEYDKSTSYGFNLPKGTWIAMYKIEDERAWQMIKNGTVKGYSIEGYFLDQLYKTYK